VIEGSQDIADGGRVECDVCIVGGGPAGITVARELETSGTRILLLEAGGLHYRKRAQALLDGTVEGDSYPRLRDTRFAGLGGASELWAGWCRPLDAIDFAARDWVPSSGWPIGRDALDPFYHRAHLACGLARPDYDAASWEARSGRRRLAVADASLATSIFHVSPQRFGRAYRRALEESPTIRVLLEAVALRCHAAPASDRIERLAAATLDGRRFDVHAAQFVLATGGVENARLLLLSGAQPATAIGNQRGLVGRYFTEHAFVEPGAFVPADPATDLSFYFPQRTPDMPAGATVRATFALSSSTLEHERLLNAAMFFLPAYEADAVFTDPAVKAMLELWDKARGRGVPGDVGGLVARAVRAPHRLVHALRQRVRVRGGRTARWRMRAFIECESLPENAIRLGDPRDAFGRPLPRLDWRLSERDVRSLQRAFALLDRALERAGQGRIELDFPDTADCWRAACTGGKHHMGTTRMHESPAQGVVDADCRVHGTANLYVAGSSVFPTGGYANPTLTIVALAIRLADHLRAGRAAPATRPTKAPSAPASTPP
jgi:choline dehydrogenase-like flavoprotein